MMSVTRLEISGGFRSSKLRRFLGIFYYYVILEDGRLNKIPVESKPL